MATGSEDDLTPTPTPTSTVKPGLTLNLGPLTTTFVPPENCDALTLGMYEDLPQTTETSTLVRWNRGYECPTTFHGTLQLISSCYPQRYGPAYDNIKDWMGPNAVWPFYSPGLLCPSGYATGCTMVYSPPGATESLPTAYPTAFPTSTSYATVSTWTLLSKGQTGYGCCPIGYRCYAPYTCISTPSLSATMTGDMTQGCAETPIKTRTTSTFVISSKMWPFVYAPQVVLIQGNDTSTTGAAAASSPSGPSTTSSASRDGDAQAGLSTAAKAAIGTAVPLIFIALALAAYIFYRRRNRSKARAEAASEQGSGFPGMNKPELDATPSPFALSLGPGSELDGTPRPSPFGDDSTAAGGRVSELPGPGVARFLGPMCELPGDEKFARRPAQPKGSDGVAADDEGGKIGHGASINGASEPKAYDTKDMDAEKSSRGGKDK
ncbi:hypothetical protein MHUMG1_01243 [Metarhizium humberi]|uniref:Uncharacterized protein n=1 Tax=Metarhizium humberi TaxID=2596975 RepID=A0A9P8MH87_9HYPO|nr:hypothetical protein MHUMG1_01243 [Metarhizium humberi]